MVAQKCAEDALRVFTESLNIANQSKIRVKRESTLQIARDTLIELKNLSNKFPFLHLENLQAVEASMAEVEAETRALPYLRSKEEEVILMCIQSQFRVINESIEIARKSKYIETKVYRLGVARNILKEARKQASQFSLEIEGFDKAEAEINRIDEAIKNGTPTEIAGMLHIDVNTAFSSAARNILIEATALKKEKKYIEACDKLREAYSADGAENLVIEERLRLPMYLQLAGKNDEGWDELNRLNSRYVDQLSQPIIAHQMRIFLRKEHNETASNPVRVILRSDNNVRPLSAAQPKPKIITTIEESRRNNIDTWKNNQDVINGLQFIATLQLRTPLRVLLRHGEIHTDINTEPPQIIKEMWEGIWTFKTKTYRELGLDIDIEPPQGTHASDAGQVIPDDYVPFLIAIRKIVEVNEPIDNRIKKLREMPMVGEWKPFIEKHGGIEKIIGRFFPKFIDTIHKLNLSTKDELYKLDLNTPNRIAAAPDETILSIKGFGQAKLKVIRDYCAGITDNRDADRVEDVIR